MMTSNLDTATPVEIDTYLAENYMAIAKARHAIASAEVSVLYAAGARREYVSYGRRSYQRWNMTFLDALAKAKDIAATDNTYVGRDAREAITKHEERTEALNALIEDAKPYHAQYDARRWTRAFLVITNGQGHVHSSMDCSTCNNGENPTVFEWLPQLSGHDENEIVELAGERACTICFKSAPVEVLSRPTSLFTKDEQQRQADKLAREAKRAEKKAAEVHLANSVDGKTVFSTERGAMNYALNRADSLLIYRYDGRKHPDEPKWHREITAIVEALAAKRGVDRSEIVTEIVTKAEKKAKREGYQTSTWPTEVVL